MPPRVVSLLPSATEALAAVGGIGLLVGRSHECDHPGGLSHLPVLTGQRLPADAEPGAIDAGVREALRQEQSLYTLDTQGLARLRPDVILTQDLCEVCSIDLASVRRVAAGLDPEPRVVSLNPRSVEGVIDDLLTVGSAVGLESGGVAAAVALRERMFRAIEHVNPFADGPVVGFLEWTDPLFCAGHWTVQLIERAGGRHPLNPTVPSPRAGAAAGPQHASALAGRSVRVPEEVFVATRPDALVICPCGLDLARTRSAARELARRSWWRDLPAVRRGRVALVDGNQMFNRPGPRLGDALDWLVGWLHGIDRLVPAGFPWEAFEG